MSEKKADAGWTATYPRLLDKRNARGMKLRILSDCPPTPTNISGIFNMKIICIDTGVTYAVLVTAQDIQNIIDALPGPFTFDNAMPFPKAVPAE